MNPQAQQMQNIMPQIPMMPMTMQYYPQQNQQMMSPQQQSSSAAVTAATTSSSSIGTPQLSSNQQTNLQIPMANIPNPYVNNIIMSHTAKHGMDGVESSGGNDIPENIKAFNDCFPKNEREAMAADFSLLEKMNLIDNDDKLYTLFMHSPSFHNSKYYFEFMSSMYRDHYKELYEKYESLSVYVEFCLATIIFENEARLKSICISNTLRLPNSGSKFTKMLRNKRNFQDTNNAEPNAKISKMNKPKHPFFDTEFYKSNQTIFSIGKCMLYCIPPDFAALFVQIKSSMVNKMEKSTPIPVKGLKITFSRPIICLISGRVNKTYTFENLEHLTHLGSIISEMTGLTQMRDAFTFGNKKNLQMIHIATSKAIESPSKCYDSGFIMVVVNNMSGYKLSNDTFTSRTYSDRIYRLDDDAHLNENELADCTTNNEAKQQELDMIIVKYEEICDQYEKNESIIINTNTPLAATTDDTSIIIPANDDDASSSLKIDNGINVNSVVTDGSKAIDNDSTFTLDVNKQEDLVVDDK